MFRALARIEGCDLTICHGGTQLGGEEPFAEVRLNPRHIGPFVTWPEFASLVDNADVAILSFDIHYLQHVAASFGRRARRVMLWGHGLGRSGLGNSLRAAMARRVGVVLLYDQISLAAFRAEGVPDSRLFVAPNTVYVEAPGRAETTERREFLFVGTLAVRKRVDQLIRVLPAVRARAKKPIALRVVGEGPELPRLRHMVEEMELVGAVSFEPSVNEEIALRMRFEHAIALVSPGHVGLSVLHAFAFGVPVITACHTGHAPEYANLNDGVNGVLFDGSDEGLIEVMVTLARDPERAERLGLAGLHHYRSNRTLAHMVTGFQAAIDSVYRNSRRGRAPAAQLP